MEYFGIFLILLAAGLSLLGRRSTRAARQPRPTATWRVIPAVPPDVAAFLVALAGIFIFATSTNMR